MKVSYIIISVICIVIIGGTVLMNTGYGANDPLMSLKRVVAGIGAAICLFLFARLLFRLQ